MFWVTFKHINFFLQTVNFSLHYHLSNTGFETLALFYKQQWMETVIFNPLPWLFFNLFKLHKISFCTIKCERSQPLHFGYCFYWNNIMSWKYLWGKSNYSVVAKCVYLCVSVCRVLSWDELVAGLPLSVAFLPPKKESPKVPLNVVSLALLSKPNFLRHYSETWDIQLNEFLDKMWLTLSE